MYYGFDIGGTKIALGVFDKQRRSAMGNSRPYTSRQLRRFPDAVCNPGDGS